MIIQIQKILMLVVASMALVACSKGGDVRAARDSNAAVGGIVTGNGCGGGTQSVGRVYDGGGSGSSFEQRVKALLSATVDPQYFGTINGDMNSSGVTMEGHLAYDSAGNVNISQTSLKLTINDSFVGQTDTSGQLITAFPINFSTATSGTFSAAGKSFSIVFKDSYGEIDVSGTINGATTTGTITFANATSFNGSSGASGTLGAFTIPTCAWTN